MDPVAVSLLVFVLLVLASVGVLLVNDRLPTRYHVEDTRTAVRSVANIFVVMTSLALGLMLNTTKNRFDSVNRDVHSFATGIIVLHRTLMTYGPEAAEPSARRRSAVGIVRAVRWLDPTPLLALVVAWLVLIFANFGYGAIRNRIVIATFVIAGALMSATLYVLLELDAPFSGPIRLSSAPLERTLAELSR